MNPVYLSEGLPEWHLKAACRGADPNLFFPIKGGAAAPAKRICAGCKVQTECLDDALATQPSEDMGVRAGTTPRSRQALRKGQESDGTKRCSNCWVVQPYDSFYPDKGTSDGRAAWCRNCRLEGNRVTHAGVLPTLRGFPHR